VVRLDLADVMDSTTSMTMTRTGLIGDREAILREIAARRGETRSLATHPAAGDAVVDTVADLRSPEPDVVRRALRRAEAAEPALVGHIIPLLARNDLFLDALRALRRGAARPRASSWTPSSTRSGTSRCAAASRASCAAPPPSAPPTASCSASPIRSSACAASARSPWPASPRASPRSRSRAPPCSRRPSASWKRPGGLGRGGCGHRTVGGVQSRGAPADAGRAGLAHVFTLLSLAVEREPLQIAYWAVLGADPGLRGTALEYLVNVLPDDVRRALWPYVGARAQARPPAIAAEPRTGPAALERHLGLDRQALKKMMPPR
jgi:hypothetical protein